MWVVGSERHEVEHFAVELGGMFVDGDGTQTREALMEKMKRYKISPSLKIFHPGLDTDDIVCPEESVRGAVKLLIKHAGVASSEHRAVK